MRSHFTECNIEVVGRLTKIGHMITGQIWYLYDGESHNLSGPCYFPGETGDEQCWAIFGELMTEEEWIRRRKSLYAFPQPERIIW